jgi:hypothetical protein
MSETTGPGSEEAGGAGVEGTGPSGEIVPPVRRRRRRHRRRRGGRRALVAIALIGLAAAIMLVFIFGEIFSALEL